MTRNIIEGVMSELCVFGGLLATRGEVYRYLAQLDGWNGLGCVARDRLVFQPPAATEADAGRLRAAGLTLVDFERKGLL